MPTSSYNAAQNRQGKLEEARNQINEGINKTNDIKDVFAAATAYAASYKQHRTSIKDKQTGAKTSSTTIRTVSSKQDSRTQWVIPPKQHDMTGALLDINTNLRNTIDDIVRQITLKYGA